MEDILLCENDCMYEGGQSNFFAVKNGTVYTRGDGVLQGTMRSMVLTLCEKLNIPVCLESPRLSEISQWDACFLTSTSRSVMNINTVRVGDELTASCLGGWKDSEGVCGREQGGEGDCCCGRERVDPSVRPSAFV